MEENINTISIATVSCKRSRTVSGSPETGVFSARTIKRFYVLIPALILLLTARSFGYQEKVPEDKKTVPALTDEEREILKDREMLENLALLKNLETIEFMDLLNEMDPDWSERDEAVIPAEKVEEGQKP
ncbi:MAG: hypothetical protein JXR49_09915 [Acidobacteria bacterium]|nr:hypothetical protein [Acidobacteriota bacterium]